MTGRKLWRMMRTTNDALHTQGGATLYFYSGWGMGSVIIAGDTSYTTD
jgi:hypothetical protein